MISQLSVLLIVCSIMLSVNCELVKMYYLRHAVILNKRDSVMNSFTLKFGTFTSEMENFDLGVYKALCNNNLGELVSVRDPPDVHMLFMRMRSGITVTNDLRPNCESTSDTNYQKKTFRRLGGMNNQPIDQFTLAYTCYYQMVERDDAKYDPYKDLAIKTGFATGAWVYGESGFRRLTDGTTLNGKHPRRLDEVSHFSSGGTLGSGSACFPTDAKKNPCKSGYYCVSNKCTQLTEKHLDSCGDCSNGSTCRMCLLPLKCDWNLFGSVCKNPA